MSYTVLARKYRPQVFADLVGQEHVTRTLGNAIETGRVAHAFLFTGVRGVGKTTSARILAKALNCEHGPTPAPCNACDPCTQITAGVDLDVLEIDGASNNGVDDVRRLQESLPYRPARDRFKVVIVDEVHMLTTGAFNAFLKTLEEPPAHVKFIFATTESHKVPVTIRSRCQRYDFRLIPPAVIADRVAHILAAESIEADAHAITIVAREAAGSMRDALTLLDQVVAFSGDKLLGSEVAQKLGLADREHLFRIAEAVLTGDARGALEVIDAVASQGLDLTHFTRQWLELMRDLVVLQVAGGRRELVELPEDERARAGELAKKSPMIELQRVFSGIAKLIDEVSKASTPRLLLEMGAVRLATRPPLQELSELIARLGRLESSNVSSPSVGGRPPPQRTGGSFEPPARGEPAPGRAPPPSRDPAAGAKPNPFQRFVPPEPGAGPTGGSAPKLEAAPTSPASAGATVTPIALGRTAAAQALSPPSPALAPPRPEPPPVRPAPAPVEPRPSAPPRNPPEAWARIVEELRRSEPRWSAMFEHGVPEELSAERVSVVFQEGSFFGRQAQSQGGLDALRRVTAAVLGRQPEVQVRFALELPGVTVAQRDAAALDERKEALKRKALSHPRVLEALKVFPELGQKHDVQVD